MTLRLRTTLALLVPACNPTPSDSDSSSSGASTTAASTSDTTSPTSGPDTTGSTGTSDPTSSTGTSEPTSSSTSGDTSEPSSGTTGSVDSTGDVETTGAPAGACAAEGGICVAVGDSARQGGAVAPSSPGGCFFDDGDAECCVPPPAKPGATTCSETGGICAPIGGCLAVEGYLTTIDDGCEFQGLFACCVPHDRCGDQTIDCCDGDAVFNPACDDGEFVCVAGQPEPVGSCL